MIRIDGSGSLERRLPLLHLDLHRPEGIGPPIHQVAPLARILLEVVELGPRRLDVLPAPAHERPELTPPEADSRKKGLGEDAALRGPRAGREIDEGERLRWRVKPGDGEGLRDGRHDVDELNRNRYARSREGRLLLAVSPGKLHEKWDLDGLTVEEHPVLALAMVPEPLPMIREEHDQRAVVEAPLLQVLKERAHDGVGSGHLAVVGVRVAAEEGLPGFVGGMGLVQVEKAEYPGLLHAIQPLDQETGRLVSGPLHVSDRLSGRRGLDVVVVEVEAARDAAGSGEDDRGHGSPRRISLLLQHLGERRNGRIETISPVVEDTVNRWERSGEKGCVRRQGERDVAVGLLEEDGLSSQGRERRRFDARVAVERQVIRAEGVDDDEEDRRTGMGRGGLTSPGPLPGTRSTQKTEEQNAGPAHGVHPLHRRSATSSRAKRWSRG